jgi:hypothetical protein
MIKRRKAGLVLLAREFEQRHTSASKISNLAFIAHGSNRYPQAIEVKKDAAKYVTGP